MVARNRRIEETITKYSGRKGDPGVSEKLSKGIAFTDRLLRLRCYSMFTLFESSLELI